MAKRGFRGNLLSAYSYLKVSCKGNKPKLMLPMAGDMRSDDGHSFLLGLFRLDTMKNFFAKKLVQC